MSPQRASLLRRCSLRVLVWWPGSVREHSGLCLWPKTRGSKRLGRARTAECNAGTMVSWIEWVQGRRQGVVTAG